MDSLDWKTKLDQRVKTFNEKREKLAKALNLDCAENMDCLRGVFPKKRKSKNLDTTAKIGNNIRVLNEPTYENSLVFLKGTITENPANDYSQYFVDTRKRPQNFIMDSSMGDRYSEYPKLRELMKLKDEQVLQRTFLPLSIKSNLRDFDFKTLKNQFDVVVIQPPLVEYLNSYPLLNKTMDLWTWDEIFNLDIDGLSSSKSFIFLWCGSYEGLEKGRMCLAKWGFRRCEDICWIKTNLKNKNISELTKDGSIFFHTKEHCLMGIKGNIKRSSDFEFIHANVDLDVIITEEPTPGTLNKPEEIFFIAEHFCMSRRRIHLFGNESDLRQGWLTIGPDVNLTNFDSEEYSQEMSGNNIYLGKSSEIEALRPKSPTLRAQNSNSIIN